jgi:hypothetical protein
VSATCLHKQSKETSDRIKCECGAEIQIDPDYEQFGLKIDRHALSHKEKTSNPSKAEVTVERVQNNLISQIFKKTSTQK